MLVFFLFFEKKVVKKIKIKKYFYLCCWGSGATYMLASENARARPLSYL
jgi:hypothetical protein